MRHSVLLGALIALLCAGSSPLWAQGATGESQREILAEQLDKRARTAYRLGEFDDAIDQWKEAFRISGHPVFLYNIAQSHRRKEDFRSAIFFYKQYLQEDPKAANRKAVEARIAELEQLLVGQEEVKDAQPQEPLSADGSEQPEKRAEHQTTTASAGDDVSPDAADQPAEEASPAEVASAEPAAAAMPATDPRDDRKTSTSGLKLAGLGTGGAGVLLVGVGVVYALRASDAESEVEAARVDGTPWSDELSDRQDAGQQAALIGKVTISLGAAALVGGGLMYFLGNKAADKERESASLRIRPSISSTELSVALGLDF